MERTEIKPMSVVVWVRRTILDFLRNINKCWSAPSTAEHWMHMAGWMCFCEQETNYTLLENFMAIISHSVRHLIWAGWISVDTLWSNWYHDFGTMSLQTGRLESMRDHHYGAERRETDVIPMWLIDLLEWVYFSIWDGRDNQFCFSINLVWLLCRKTNENECLPKPNTVETRHYKLQTASIDFCIQIGASELITNEDFPRDDAVFLLGRWKIATVYMIQFQRNDGNLQFEVLMCCTII